MGNLEAAILSGVRPRATTTLMRVCHIVRQYHPGVGGLESFVGSLATHLNAENCQSDVLTLDRVFTSPKARLSLHDTVAAVRVRRVGMIGHRRVFLPLIPSSTLKDYDVLHVHGIDGMFERVAREPRRTRQLLIATSHGGFFHTPWMAPLKRIYFASVTKLAARSYDCLIANSTADQHMLSALGPATELIPNGVEPLSQNLATGRDMLYLGRLATHKHVAKLVALLAEPPLRDVRLHVVGPAWDVSPEALQALASSLGVSDRLHIHGHLPMSVLRDVAQRCGIFVSASAYEGFGMSLVEAMSAGLIPVVNANPSFAELLSAAPVGRLADFDDRARSAAAVREEIDLLSDNRREQARHYAAQYGWPSHAARTAALYHRLMDERAS